LEYGRSTIFTVSVDGVTQTEAAGIHKLCTTKAIAHTPEAKWSYDTSAMNDSLKNHDPQCLCPTCRRSCESAGEQGYKERQPVDGAATGGVLMDMNGSAPGESQNSQRAASFET
jgi:hypothetical protein